MTLFPDNYEYIQTVYTSTSRGTRMGRRVVRNVSEFASYLKPPIVCIGCGDGLEIECMLNCFNISVTTNLTTKEVIGVEVSKERVKVAQQYNLPVYEGSAENILEILGEDKKYNVYMAHCLEHCYDLNLVIENLKKIALDTIVIIVPIELRGLTRNRAHYNPISNLGYLINLFGLDWKITTGYRWNIELEGYMIIQRNPVNWPSSRKLKGPNDLLIKDASKR